MTLAATLRTAVTGLATSQQALAVTANNVANAGTEGYVRKVHAQEAIVHDGRGAGARALDPRRVVDEFLMAELRNQSARLGRSRAVEDVLGRVQGEIFGAPGETGRAIQDRIAALAAAAEALANDPSKAAQRAELLGAAEAVATALSRAGEQVQRLRADADRRIDQLIDAINADVAALERVNEELARGRPSAELEDRRDRLLASLAERVDISTYRLEDGRVAVYLRGGQPLLEGTRRVLVYDPAPVVSATTLFGPIALYAARDIDPTTGEPVAGAVGSVVVTGGLRAELPPELATGTPADEPLIVRSPFAEGELQGLLEARDRVLPELADQLDELARLTRYVLDAAHNAAVAWPPPESLTGSRLEDGTFDASARSGTAWLAVIDRTTGATLHTVAIDLTADLATLVAQLDADLSGHGDAGLDGDGRLVITLDPGKGVALADGDGTITVTDEAGRSWDYGFSHYFGLNDLFTVDPDRPTALALRADLAGSPALLATARLDVDPGPPPRATLGGPGDPRGAHGLAAAFARSVATVPRGSLDRPAATIGGYAADLVGAVAVRAARAVDAAETDRAMVEELERRMAEISGVNMDEELARLVLYQQAYSVSARIVQITDELFDELMSIGR
ncbi:MAG: flagellar hook-associated protein 1 [Geminicoccaceae bacterium]|nr:MAG: flagellar hook-associated protein 1 [Geminicoccaceae bacterium]